MNSQFAYYTLNQLIIKIYTEIPYKIISFSRKSPGLSSANPAPGRRKRATFGYKYVQSACGSLNLTNCSTQIILDGSHFESSIQRISHSLLFVGKSEPCPLWCKFRFCSLLKLHNQTMFHWKFKGFLKATQASRTILSNKQYVPAVFHHPIRPFASAHFYLRVVPADTCVNQRQVGSDDASQNGSGTRYVNRTIAK